MIKPGAASRVASLDGLRALAIILVLIDHAASHFEGGGVGVCVFFVLSGFLITSLLTGERRRTATVNPKLFYARRLLRLYPALLVMLGITVALGCSAKMAAIAATYTTDLYSAVWSHDIGPYQHTWSLALEEQFYLLWPLALPLALRHGRRAGYALLAAAVASAAAAVVGTLAMVSRDGHITSAVFNPIWQAHGLLIGCALAVFLDRGLRVARTRALSLVLGGSAAVVAVALIASVTVNLNLAAIWNLMAELAAAAIIVGLTSGASLPRYARFYESRLAVWIGKRSYAIYLWHAPLIYIVARDGLAPHGISVLSGAGMVGVALSFVAAAISFRFVEQPFLRLKDRLHPSVTTERPTAVPPVPERELAGV
jgi:peptidoglycan/LPS O-acetylase OafA/YrhL